MREKGRQSVFGLVLGGVGVGYFYFGFSLVGFGFGLVWGFYCFGYRFCGGIVVVCFCQNFECFKICLVLVFGVLYDWVFIIFGEGEVIWGFYGL